VTLDDAIELNLHIFISNDEQRAHLEIASAKMKQFSLAFCIPVRTISLPLISEAL